MYEICASFWRAEEVDVTTRNKLIAAVTLTVLAAVAGACDTSTPEDNAPKKVDKAAAAAKENAGRVRDIKAKCAETTDEGKGVIEKVKAWNPVVNGHPANKSLKDIAATYVTNGIYEICWGASQKGNGRWKVAYDYIDVKGSFQEAEWEYDPASGQTQVFNQNATTFWAGEQ